MRAAGLDRGEIIAGHGLTKQGAAKSAGMEGAGEAAKLGAGASGSKNGVNQSGCGWASDVAPTGPMPRSRKQFVTIAFTL